MTIHLAFRGLNFHELNATLCPMKLISMEEAQEQFAALCNSALAGEVIRLQLANGALLELKPVPTSAPVPALSEQELAKCYDDADWAAFENHCAKAND